MKQLRGLAVFLRDVFVSLYVLATLVFFLLRCLPGGPFDLESHLSPEIYLKLNQAWGLDQSLPTQYFNYMMSLVQGKMGNSYFHQQASVEGLIFTAFRQTAAVSSLSLAVVILGSLGLGFFLVQSRLGFLKTGIENALMALNAWPSLFLGPLLLYFFSFRWNLFPMAFLENPWSYVLPVVSLSGRSLSHYTQVVAQSWREALMQPFVRAARSRGLSFRRILFFHAFRFSLPVLLSLLPSLVISLFSGAIFVEILFSIPGLGVLFVEALNQRDYPVALGVTLFYGALALIISTLCEHLRRSLDPRGEVQGGEA